MDAPIATSASSSRPWLKWLLVASLAVNVLIVGVVLGAMFRGGQRGAPQNIVGYVMSLPNERRQDLMKRSAAVRAEVKALRQQVRAAARERNAAIIAEPFDRARYVAAQTKQIEAEAKVRMIMRDVVAETAAGMTLDERRGFMRWRGSSRSSLLDDGDPPQKP
jgi:uncharacterized membrane protein